MSILSESGILRLPGEAHKIVQLSILPILPGEALSFFTGEAQNFGIFPIFGCTQTGFVQMVQMVWVAGRSPSAL